MSKIVYVDKDVCRYYDSDCQTHYSDSNRKDQHSSHYSSCHPDKHASFYQQLLNNRNKQYRLKPIKISFLPLHIYCKFNIYYYLNMTKIFSPKNSFVMGFFCIKEGKQDARRHDDPDCQTHYPDANRKDQHTSHYTRCHPDQQYALLLNWL